MSTNVSLPSVDFVRRISTYFLRFRSTWKTCRTIFFWFIVNPSESVCREKENDALNKSYFLIRRWITRRFVRRSRNTIEILFFFCHCRFFFPPILWEQKKSKTMENERPARGPKIIPVRQNEKEKKTNFFLIFLGQKQNAGAVSRTTNFDSLRFRYFLL